MGLESIEDLDVLDGVFDIKGRISQLTGVPASSFCFLLLFLVVCQSVKV